MTYFGLLLTTAGIGLVLWLVLLVLSMTDLFSRRVSLAMMLAAWACLALPIAYYAFVPKWDANLPPRGVNFFTIDKLKGTRVTWTGRPRSKVTWEVTGTDGYKGSFGEVDCGSFLVHCDPETPFYRELDLVMVPTTASAAEDWSIKGDIKEIKNSRPVIELIRARREESP